MRIFERLRSRKGGEIVTLFAEDAPRHAYDEGDEAVEPGFVLPPARRTAGQSARRDVTEAA